MTELQFYQAYWWLLIAVLGATLVFLMFVQGGQSMLYCGRATDEQRSLMINSLGRKWELTFTTLVVFGGAFFASFPLFYSTSFGGAYWLWMSILISFVLQAVSYEYRSKDGNIFGTRTYDTFLLINGCAGCVLLGVALGTLFFGGDFEVVRTNLLDPANPVISRWAPTRGLEAIASWQCLLLGVAVFFLARTQAALYFINNIKADAGFEGRMRRSVLINGAIFAVLFVAWMLVLMLAAGKQMSTNGEIVEVENLYFNNFISMWWWLIVCLLGVVFVLSGIAMGAFSKARCGIWLSGIGTVLVVIALFAVAGYNNTSYLASNTHIQSSLTLANSSSSLYTLKTMSYVSLFIPVVIGYIAVVWRKMNKGGLSETDLKNDGHIY